MELFRGTNRINSVYLGSQLLYLQSMGESPFSYNIVTDGLAIYYDFGHLSNGQEGSTSARNLISDNYHGVHAGFNYTEESGYGQNGLVFDGVNDRIVIPRSQDLETNDWTVEVTGKIMARPSSNMRLFGNSDYHIGLYVNNSLVFNYHESNDWTFAGVPYELNKVTHWVFKRDGGTIYVFEDGELKTSRPAGPNDYRNNDILIGQWIHMVYHSIRLYTRALTDEQILSNYMDENKRYALPHSSGFDYNVVEDNLLFYYDFGHTTNESPDSHYAKNITGTEHNGVHYGFNYIEGSGYETHGLRFDGVNDAIEVPSSTQLNTSEWTVEITAAVYSNNNSYFTPVFFNSDYHISIELRPDNNTIGAYHESSPHTFASAPWIQWELAHWTFKREQGVIYCYKNGVVVSNRAVGENTYSTNPISIGGTVRHGTYSDMLISSVRYYGKALNNTEITSNYEDELTRYPIGDIVNPSIINLLENTTWVDGYLSGDGSLNTDNAQGQTSAFAPVEYGKNYRYIQKYDNRTLQRSTLYVWVGYYDENQELVNHSWYPQHNVPSNQGNFSVNLRIDEGEHYIRVGGDIFVSAMLIEV